MPNRTSTCGVAKNWRLTFGDSTGELSSVFDRSKPSKRLQQQLHNKTSQELHNNFLTADVSSISQQSSPREIHNSPTKGSIVTKASQSLKKKKKLHNNFKKKKKKSSKSFPLQPRFFASHNPRKLHQETHKQLHQEMKNPQKICQSYFKTTNPYKSSKWLLKKKNSRPQVLFKNKILEELRRMRQWGVKSWQKKNGDIEELK